MTIIRDKHRKVVSKKNKEYDNLPLLPEYKMELHGI